MNKPTWTEEQDNVIRSMFAERKTAREVAEQLNVTRNAVLGRAFRLGLKKVKVTEVYKPQKGLVGRPKGSKNHSGDAIEFRNQLIDSGLHEVMSDAREVGMSWAAIAVHLGIGYPTVIRYAHLLNLWAPKPQKRMTEEDIQTIIADWNNFVPTEETADKIGRSFGVVRQKILQLQKAGLLGGRQPHGTMLVKRYGRLALINGEDPRDTFAKLQAAKQAAYASALEAARKAKKARNTRALEDMQKAIADGMDRNIAIFNCRAEGVTLEEIAEAVGGLTRERIRQICEKVAHNMALEKYLTDHNEEGKTE